MFTLRLVSIFLVICCVDPLAWYPMEESFDVYDDAGIVTAYIIVISPALIVNTHNVCVTCLLSPFLVHLFHVDPVLIHVFM